MARFQKVTKVPTTFAGIEFDPVDNAFRHVSTGILVSHGYFRFKNKTLDPTNMHNEESWYGWEKGK